MVKELTKLYDWQRNAIANLEKNKWRGIISAVTGSGKTYVAVHAMTLLKQKTLIVVPTIALMNQWKGELISNGFKEKDISLYYGESKSFNKITIAVINSVYELLDLDKKFSLLVVDEIHRLGAEQFQKLLLNNTFKYSIGLTATIERNDGNHNLLIKQVGDIVIQYSNEDALNDDVINSVELINIGIDLPPKEKAYLKALDDEIKELMDKFGNDMNKVVGAIKMKNRTAGKCLKLINERKKFFNNSMPKILKAESIIKDLYSKPYNKGLYIEPYNKVIYNKIIVFGEYIESIDTLYNLLKKDNINSYVYYSGNNNSKFKLNNKDKKELLNNYSNDNKGILLTVKALDEGLNIKDINVGLILGYNKTTRQAIQRMGRVLRKDQVGRATMYNFYYRNTSDYWNAKNLSQYFEEIGVVRWR